MTNLATPPLMAWAGAGLADSVPTLLLRCPTSSTICSGNSWADAAEELAARFEDAGVAAIIYTDIDRDGINLGEAAGFALLDTPQMQRLRGVKQLGAADLGLLTAALTGAAAIALYGEIRLVMETGSLFGARFAAMSNPMTRATSEP